MAQHQKWPVSIMCEVMQVSRSGLSADVQRQASTGIGAEEGARLAKQLQADGFSVGRYKAKRLMRQAKVIVQRSKQRSPVTTDSRQGDTVAPNRWARQCAVENPDQVWGGDITSGWTAEGWLYLAVRLDGYSRKVVGWAMSPHVAAALVRAALQLAWGRRQPAEGLIHHSDRGSQYACDAYHALLAKHGIHCSMSRKGDCLEKAGAERFLGSGKGERTSLQPYARRQEARDAVSEYIDMFYNSRRLHSY